MITLPPKAVVHLAKTSVPDKRKHPFRLGSEKSKRLPNNIHYCHYPWLAPRT